MTSFALVAKATNIVDNIVVGDEPGMLVLAFPDHNVLEVTDETHVAYIGLAYDVTSGKFMQPQPFASWVWNKDLWKWEPPLEYPTDGKHYYWDEQTVTWVEFELPFAE